MGWPECSGMGGRLPPESVAGINRNRWPASSGIAGRNRPEYALTVNRLNDIELWAEEIGKPDITGLMMRIPLNPET